ncbi:M48 family metalloprotease [Nevskia sp.]|uniref:M48 family metalloprotease n=1 Tax=Nevskia sp. TaxID=1929292 RepID=UPI0025D4B63F|nr:M48 family metalloprotease [Nevskia sp.]
MLPVFVLLCLIAVLRLALLLRQRAVLTDEAYARGLVTQRVGQQLWQQGWPLLLVALAPFVAQAGGLAPSVLALVLLVALGWLWELPPKIVKVFGLDAAHGMNRMTVAAFAREQALKLVLLVVLAVPGATVALALIERSGDHWWLPAWAVGWSGWGVLRWAQPQWITPLFDRVEPLPAGDLRQRLERLLLRCGVVEPRLYLVRASARSAQANAQVTGGIGAPRIVLSDTLIDKLPPDEVEAVVAHELGHLQRGHLRFQVLMLGAAWLLLMAVAGMATNEIGDPVTRLAMAWALLPSLWFFAQPLVNHFYRRFEFEADASAAENASGHALARALRTLTRNNRNAPVADRWYERVYHTHPATSERLRLLDQASH